MIWLVVAFFFGFLNWLAIWFNWGKVIHVAKPATLFFLLLWSWQLSGWQGGLIWFGLALIFSLVGDIVLMFPPKYFLFGLAAFFFGHIFYIIGLNTPFQTPRLWMIAPLASVILGYVWIMSTVLRGLRKNPSLRSLQVPVLIYGLVISGMVFSALCTIIKPDWSNQAALLVTSGSILFLFSDSILAYARFVSPMPRERFWVMISYHLAQFGLITGALLWAGVL